MPIWLEALRVVMYGMRIAVQLFFHWVVYKAYKAESREREWNPRIPEWVSRIRDMSRVASKRTSKNRVSPASGTEAGAGVVEKA